MPVAFLQPLKLGSYSVKAEWEAREAIIKAIYPSPFPMGVWCEAQAHWDEGAIQSPLHLLPLDSACFEGLRA